MGDQTIRCSNCEAMAKDIDPKAPTFICAFCGAQNQNPIYEAPPPRRAAPAGAAMPAPLAPPSATARKTQWLLFGGVGFVLLMGLAAGFWLTVSGGPAPHGAPPSSTAALPPAAPKLQIWFESLRPLPIDVDGDGLEDLIARSHNITRLRGVKTRDEHVVTCTSGKTFAPLWKIPAKDSDHLWYASNLLLLGHDQHLMALNLKDGKTRWKVAFPDKIQVIAEDKGQLRVLTADEHWTGVDPQTGTLTPKVKEPHFHLRRDTLYFRDKIRDDAYGDLRRPSRRFAGFRVKAVYCPVHRRTRFRSNGRKLVWHDHHSFCKTPYGLAEVVPKKGTPVPSFLGYARKGKKELWRRALAKNLETFAKTPLIDLDETSAFAIYTLGKRPRILELFSLANGKVAWRRAETKAKPVPKGLALGKQRVYIIYGWGGGMQILDRKSGKTLGWIR